MKQTKEQAAITQLKEEVNKDAANFVVIATR
jgi:hypothetical protein